MENWGLHKRPCPQVSVKAIWMWPQGTMLTPKVILLSWVYCPTCIKQDHPYTAHVVHVWGAHWFPWPSRSISEIGGVYFRKVLTSLFKQECSVFPAFLYDIQLLYSFYEGITVPRVLAAVGILNSGPRSTILGKAERIVTSHPSCPFKYHVGLTGIVPSRTESRTRMSLVKRQR